MSNNVINLSTSRGTVNHQQEEEPVQQDPIQALFEEAAEAYRTLEDLITLETETSLTTAGTLQAVNSLKTIAQVSMTILNALIHDLRQSINQIMSQQGQLAILSSQIQTFNGVLQEKGVMNEEELKEYWDKHIKPTLDSIQKK